MWSSLCPETHAKLLGGRCPWCGRSIFGRHAVTWATFLIDSLGNSGHITGESLEGLLAVLHDDDIDVTFLIDRLDDSHRNVREACVRLLGRLGDKRERVISALRKVASGDIDPQVQDAARKVRDHLLGD